MAYFAQIEDGKVANVIAVSNDVMIDADGNESEEMGQQFIAGLNITGIWKQTSYNTQGGKHADGGNPVRKNYAGIGCIYDEARDAFYAPQPYPSWTLNEDTCQWNPPVPYPLTEPVEGERPPMYRWSEGDQVWDELEIPGT